MDEGLEDRVLDELKHVSSVLHNPAYLSLFKINIAHILTEVVSHSSEEVVSSAVQLWESKMMQSKAMEDFRKNNINSSNFVLQLPASYSRTDQELTGV